MSRDSSATSWRETTGELVNTDWNGVSKAALEMKALGLAGGSFRNGRRPHCGLLHPRMAGNSQLEEIFKMAAS